MLCGDGEVMSLYEKVLVQGSLEDAVDLAWRARDQSLTSLPMPSYQPGRFKLECPPSCGALETSLKTQLLEMFILHWSTEPLYNDIGQRDEYWVDLKTLHLGVHSLSKPSFHERCTLRNPSFL